VFQDKYLNNAFLIYFDNFYLAFTFRNFKLSFNKFCWSNGIKFTLVAESLEMLLNDFAKVNMMPVLRKMLLNDFAKVNMMPLLRQILLNDFAKVNMMPVLRQILLDDFAKVNMMPVLRQILLDDFAKVNMMPVLQQILFDENLKFLGVWVLVFLSKKFLTQRVLSMRLVKKVSSSD